MQKYTNTYSLELTYGKKNGFTKEEITKNSLDPMEKTSLNMLNSSITTVQFASMNAKSARGTPKGLVNSSVCCGLAVPAKLGKYLRLTSKASSWSLFLEADKRLSANSISLMQYCVFTQFGTSENLISLCSIELMRLRLDQNLLRVVTNWVFLAAP